MFPLLFAFLSCLSSCVLSLLLHLVSSFISDLLFFFSGLFLSCLSFSVSLCFCLSLSLCLCLRVVWCVARLGTQKKPCVEVFWTDTRERGEREGRGGGHRQFCLPRKAHEKVLTWPHKFTERNPWILPIRSLRIDRLPSPSPSLTHSHTPTHMYMHVYLCMCV